MCTIDSIVSYGIKYGYTHLGLVDRNVLAGAMAFKKACEKVSIKPVYGLEFDLEAEERIYTMILYAKDDEGYKNLMGLSSHICSFSQWDNPVPAFRQHAFDPGDR